jgi:SfnB family sulfur acquisition oxidoreductase
MTTEYACPVLSSTDAISVARSLAAEFAVGAAERDRNRELPFRELKLLSASGLLAITVPAEYGGADLPPSTVTDVIRILSAADPNIGQIPHSHFVYANLLRLAGSDEQRAYYAQQLLNGAQIANAQAERNGPTAADVATTLSPTGDGRFRIDGTKYYCTGSVFADILAVLTRLDDPDGTSGLPDGQYIAFLPADTPGVQILDDWDALGQRTTASGTIIFDGVVVEASQVMARAAAVNAPTGYGAFAQLMHAAIDLGIARGALEAAADFVREKSRPWFEAGVTHAIDDPLLIQRFGELAVTVAAAEAAFGVAGAELDTVMVDGHSAEQAARASLAVATAKTLADNASTEVSSALFELGGTRSTATDLNLGHYWRNARTHSVHDPIRWKYQHIGRALLHGTPPPLHSAI